MRRRWMAVAVVLGMALAGAGAGAASAQETVAAAPSDPAAEPRTNWQRTAAVYGALYG